MDIGAIPYLKLLGITVETDAAAAGDVVLARMVFSDVLVGNPNLPALHGGTLGALLETVSILEVVHAVDAEALPKTINITIDYLRSGRPEDTFARATVTKLGRRVANVRAVAWQGDPDKPIAIANGHFLVKARSES